MYPKVYEVKSIPPGPTASEGPQHLLRNVTSESVLLFGVPLIVTIISNNEHTSHIPHPVSKPWSAGLSAAVCDKIRAAFAFSRATCNSGEDVPPNQNSIVPSGGLADALLYFDDIPLTACCYTARRCYDISLGCPSGADSSCLRRRHPGGGEAPSVAPGGCVGVGNL